MKTIKTLFAVLFLSTFFIACEADVVSEEIGIDGNENFISEDAEGEGVVPELDNGAKFEDAEGEGVDPEVGYISKIEDVDGDGVIPEE
ncbi:hypothetical protein AWE51_21245 [Aquimarina aggregata]|uniref:EF-hand domain-containing protein n=1 Tax=Aquimarina aggregata TaxID=1642818 RepID=A0A163BM42_9FLAO|nr:hypothetical protein [Aquimarina aggregata]KZS41535.1 hypothetical protein AWE51_21245 [Aquimarina aggregata]